ncbi:MAG: NYN domain-containing protein, partial [Ilumatobacteraceae bacterium]
GWEARVAELVAAADAAAEEADGAAALRRADRRREAAEQVAIRTRAELLSLEARIEELDQQLDAARAVTVGRSAEMDALRAQAAEARVATRHANDRAEAARSRLAGVEHERDVALQRASTAEAQRDALLADRAERSGIDVSGAQVTELRELARSARSVAERLNRLVDTGPAGRVALPLPGGVARDSRRATEYLLRAPHALVLVDGYNVAKLAWPDDDLVTQRTRCLDLVDDLARRIGPDVTVVFDGADVVGAHAPRRRLVRVVYSPAGVSADDVIRAEVDATTADRPVVVVTNDQAIRRDVAAAGANLVTSDALLALR